MIICTGYNVKNQLTKFDGEQRDCNGNNSAADDGVAVDGDGGKSYIPSMQLQRDYKF